MNRPRITVIVPSLNAAGYLERTMCSVLDQPYEHVELMVMDGGSTDGSAALLERYADELAWSRSAPDAGPAEAINRALPHATGDVIGILPAGALYLPETLAHVAAWFASNDAPRWLVSHCMRIGPEDQELGRIEANRPASLRGYLMHATGLLPQAGTFYHRHIFDAHGPFDAHLRHAFGYEMSARLLAAGESPTIALRLLAAEREDQTMRGIEPTLRRGREYIETASHHAEALPFHERCTVWRNCEERRRIYALAEAEAHADAARRLLWQRLLHHPWWLADPTYRRALLHGVHHPTRPTAPRTPTSPLPAA